MEASQSYRIFVVQYTKMKKDNCKKLFDLLDSIGETLTGDLHIIDNTDRFSCEGEKEYRVYHADGYCFDSFKKANEVDEETGDIKTYEFDFFAEWEGFDKIDEVKAIKLIKKTILKINPKDWR